MNDNIFLNEITVLPKKIVKIHVTEKLHDWMVPNFGIFTQILHCVKEKLQLHALLKTAQNALVRTIVY